MHLSFNFTIVRANLSLRSTDNIYIYLFDAKRDANAYSRKKSAYSRQKLKIPFKKAPAEIAMTEKSLHSLKHTQRRSNFFKMFLTAGNIKLHIFAFKFMRSMMAVTSKMEYKWNSHTINDILFSVFFSF